MRFIRNYLLMDMSSLETGHKKGDVATNRPSYREARWERAVKVSQNGLHFG